MYQPIGGFGPEQSATIEIQKICDEMKQQVQQKARKTFEMFVAKSFISQLVAGTNFFIKMKQQVQQKARKTFEMFVAKSFISQLVAGTNFFIKVHVGGNDCVHLRVFRSLPCAGSRLELHGVQTAKKLTEPISYF
ncbi:hypothetical protein AOLI_G00262990 [Acnodon oligacanthus]